MSKKFNLKPRFSVSGSNIGTASVVVHLNLAAAKSLCDVLEETELDQDERFLAVLNTSMKQRIEKQEDLEERLRSNYKGPVD